MTVLIRFSPLFGIGFPYLFPFAVHETCKVMALQAPGLLKMPPYLAIGPPLFFATFSRLPCMSCPSGHPPKHSESLPAPLRANVDSSVTETSFTALCDSNA